MFRKTSGSILCPSCGRLTNADARECLICGRRNPGLWGFAGPLQMLFRRHSFVDVVTVACIALYILTLLLDPAAAMRGGNPFNLFAPSPRALIDAGAAGALPWQAGRWWTVLTAIYLHGGPLHILFNVMWIRQLGPAVEELYGPSRLVVIFTVAGVVGFIASNMVGYGLTIGASGSIFGLLGAMVAFGHKRGGAFGAMVLRQYGQWAVLLFIMGFLMAGVNNVAHAGGFVGGFGAGLVLALAERRGETGLDRLLAVACIGLTVLGFGLAFWTAFVG
ncbi:MAG TPA: rhomboid family intramembrane serine protease [Opitutaceae bacterium]|nr:rhomboid family intramembrane serine protease [Opitutaceae bacterium]